MLKIRWYSAVVCTLAAYLAVLPAWGDESVKAEEGRKYEVQKGDTLWDIAGQKLGNSFQWPRIWKENPDLKNPDRIYPGYILTMPGDGKDDIGAPQEPPKEEAAQEEPEVVEEARKKEVALPEPEPPVLLAGVKTVLFSGFIASRNGRYNRIVAGPDGLLLHGAGSTMFAETGRADIKVGDRYTVVRKARTVVHPETAKVIGDLVEALGVAQVTAIQKGVATLQVTDSRDAITEGDLLTPYVEPQPLFVEQDKKAGARAQTRAQNGYVIEFREDKALAGQHDIVYVDKGNRDGVAVGDAFKVVRQGEKLTALRDRKATVYPDEVLGEIRIIGLQETTSTAIVARTSNTISRGDRFATR